MVNTCKYYTSIYEGQDLVEREDLLVARGGVRIFALRGEDAGAGEELEEDRLARDDAGGHAEQAPDRREPAPGELPHPRASRQILRHELEPSANFAMGHTPPPLTNANPFL